MASFNDLKLIPELLQRLHELDFHTPTPIQAAAIPRVLNGNDVVGQAETGSGKTGAYGLPLLQQIDPSQQRVQAVIIVPTRELVLQVQRELKQFAQGLSQLKIGAFYGGHAFAEERASLAFPPQVLVGTPGRLTDHLSRRTLDLRAVTKVVLDEADKLLEMGFEEEVNLVLGAIPARQQTILFSATMPPKVKDLIARFLRKPNYVEVAGGAIPDQIRFLGVRVGQVQREKVLLALVQSLPAGGSIIFVNTRTTADSIAGYLQARQLPVKPLHGGMEQPDRDRTMLLFRNGTVPILVATDLASRGLDIADLTSIIHYELPDDEDSFLHRSGRTGRAGQAGTVYVLANPAEERKLHHWEQVPLTEWVNPASLKPQTAAAKAEAAPAFVTLHINGGRKDKLSARDIVGALVAEAGLQGDQIGKIEVQERASFVAVPAGQGGAIAETLSAGKIKGRKFRVSLVR